ncbi:hypothetical protein HSY10_004763, partial [Salmonella enterica]|nr:hypothetical protein [Salmonella enterica]EHY8087991.1 hypothetical protein [Salmonella enterica]
VPSVNATVPGAVTVTTPAQDAAGNVAATLTYVDTSGQLLSKAARAGTTTIAIGKAVKQTVDTRFYPQVHVCTTYLTATGFIVPGQTEVRICDGSNRAVPDGSGYTVTLAGMSSAGCTKSGGGVCPPNTAGAKADFTGLTGDDIAELAFNATPYEATDEIANVTIPAGRPAGLLAYYGELKTHFPYSALGGIYGKDIFHVSEAKAFCSRAAHDTGNHGSITYDDALSAGTTTGGPTTAGTSGVVKSLYIGNITGAITTGGDTNPELFVSGGGYARTPYQVQGSYRTNEVDANGVTGAFLPRMVVLINGGRHASTYWSLDDYSADYNGYDGTEYKSISIGSFLPSITGWNLSDMYYVNNWPGTPLASHKPDKYDANDQYVTQVNYVSGYVCEASLQ